MSTSYAETPLVDVGPNEEAALDTTMMQVNRMLPDVQLNWAEHEDVRRQVLEYVVPVVDWTRNRRKALELEWEAIRRMNLLQHDEGQRYLGRSNAYVPAWARALSNLTSNISRGLFPSDEYMEVSPQNNTPTESAQATKQYLQYEFEKIARLRQVIKPFVRQFFNYGVSVGKYWYEKERASRKQGRNVLNPFTKMLDTQYANVFDREGLRFSVRSIYNWYIYPATAASLDEATMCFEDIDTSLAYILEMKTKKIWLNVDQAINAAVISDHVQKQAQQLADTTGDSTAVSQSPFGGNPLADFRTLTEVWCNLVLPKAAYVGDESEGMPVPCRIVLASGVPVSVTRNPFWHQQPPYLVARMEVETGSFYPKGTGFMAKSLQYLVNDFTNQLNDNGTYAMNPLVKMNPATLAGPLPPIRPGAVWQTTDPANGIVFDRPPVEQLQYGIQLVNMYSGMVADFSGAPPILQGTGAGKGARTATGAQILQRNAMSPLQDLVEDIEGDVTQRLMFGAWVLGQQYREQPVMDSIAGMPIKVSPEQLTGDFSFRWLASSQAMNSQQRAQQAIMLLQSVQPLIPFLMQLGYKVDPVPLLKRLYSDGMGFRGFDQFIQKVDAAGGMPGASGVQGVPGVQDPLQVQAGLGNVRSALEQEYGAEGAPPMVAGEAEDFAEVRDNADQMAAMMGMMK